MTEAKWLESVYPGEMLWHLNCEGTAQRLQLSARKLRLFACACCRHIWDKFVDERQRAAVAVVESVAEGLIDEGRLDVARAEVGAIPYAQGGKAGLAVLMLTGKPDLVYYEEPSESTVVTVAAHTSMWAASASGEKFNEPNGADGRYFQEKYQCESMRDIFGNPFRTVNIVPAWLTPVVTGLAYTIYEERAFDRMPELADALDTAGCTNVDILKHCREPNSHLRGCWVVDLILGKF